MARILPFLESGLGSCVSTDALTQASFVMMVRHGAFTV